MKQELIRNNMTSPAISISSDTVLAEAHNLMAEKGVRRLPVVDGEKLVGLVSLSDVLEAKPSDATSLSIWELNYLISKIRIKAIMSKNIYTVSKTDSVAVAAKLMLDKKVGGIPVTDEEGKLCGIITESDIFRLVADEL